MSEPFFTVRDLGRRCYAIDANHRTVATISPHGFVDWLLRRPTDRGERIERIVKWTHLSYTLGLKIELTCPYMKPAAPKGTELVALDWRNEPDGSLTLVGDGRSAQGAFESCTAANLHIDPDTGEYAWRLSTRITCQTEQPVQIDKIEYNNVYPGAAGRCMLFAPQKRYDRTLVTDAAGAVWHFPHQHTMHYGDRGKFDAIRGAAGVLGGFFGEDDGSPAVIIDRADLEPSWAICDMYYDLHVCARTPEPIEPGQTLRFDYQVKYLSPSESQKLVERARPIAVTADDYAAHDYPTLELGINKLNTPAPIDQPSDASVFRPEPPARVWDRQVGPAGCGSLRLTNDQPGENVWTGNPPSVIPAEHTLRLSAKVRTEGVTGKGAFLRVRYFSFEWEPTPHMAWHQAPESSPVDGTSDGWVRVEVPALSVPAEHVDSMVRIDAVLEGEGRAWVSQIDVDLQPTEPDEGHALDQPTEAHAGAGIG